MAAVRTEPGRPGFLRSMNDRAALRLLIGQGPLTRVQLSVATGLSGPTTSQVINRLSQAGLVDEAGSAVGSRGPNATVYRARTESVFGVAAHVLPDHIVARVVDPSGQLHPIAELRLPAKGRFGPADLSSAMDAACASAGRARDEVVAVCVGVPGAVSPDSDELRFVGPLRGWPRRDVRAQFEEHLGVRVLIENDANLAAVAEADARPAEDDFALLWLGEGLAVVAVSDGRMRRGVSGGAGEIGYVPTSRTAIGIDPQAADMQELAGAGAVTRLVRVRRPATRTFTAALSAIRNGDLRPALLADLAPRVAEILAPVIAVLDPGRVILGGPTGAACGPDGAALVQAQLRRATRWRTPVAATLVPDHPVLDGAALTLAQHLTEQLLDRIG